jgi:hypothetical protein
MLIENGRLVPVAQWDQERVMSYRNGSVVNVRVTQEKNRKLERKYWAILHEVVDKCGIRQRTAEDLHKAIRLKLGVVDAYWTLDGKLRVDVKSTVGMEEPEYRQFFEDAMALLHKETGIDPLTLQSEAADVGEDDDSQSSDTPSPSDEGSDGAMSPGHTVAADHSPDDESGKEEGENTGQVTTEQAAPSSDLSAEDRDWLLSVAKQLWAGTGIGEQELVAGVAADLRNSAPETISQAARAKALSIVKQCKLVCFGEQEATDTLEIVAGIAGVETAAVVS